MTALSATTGNVSKYQAYKRRKNDNDTSKNDNDTHTVTSGLKSTIIMQANFDPREMYWQPEMNQNIRYIFIFGAAPETMINLDSSMVKNLLDNILNKQDPKELSVVFPEVLNRIRADDVNFE